VTTREMAKTRKHVRQMKRQGFVFSRYLGWYDREKMIKKLMSGYFYHWMGVDFVVGNKVDGE
jgi:hypothetical protein